MKKYFENIEEHEKIIIAGMCKAIESGSMTAIVAGKRWKAVEPDRSYILDWSYNLQRWGFAKKARGSEHHLALHPYCPIQDISSTFANFLNTSVEMGYYTRKTEKKINGGRDYQII
ncbi:MAG: hypothetical protein IKY94_11730 [Lachnospiraceae bacterium]|nr:hypothetical protein [Lachnospiraceae bacterium]